jgi:hypothetical protein
MARKQTTSKTPKRKPQEEEGGGQEGHGFAPNDRPVITKAEAVRRAMAAGMNMPDDGVGFIKAQFGIDLPKQMWSSYRAQQKARDAKKAEGKSKRVEGYLAPPSKKSANGEGDLLAAMEAIKPLVDNLGKDQAHRIIDLLG